MNFELILNQKLINIYFNIIIIIIIELYFGFNFNQIIEQRIFKFIINNKWNSKKENINLLTNNKIIIIEEKKKSVKQKKTKNQNQKN